MNKIMLVSLAVLFLVAIPLRINGLAVSSNQGFPYTLTAALPGGSQASGVYVAVANHDIVPSLLSGQSSGVYVALANQDLATAAFGAQSSGVFVAIANHK